jgi:hypothetical protein
MIKIRLVGENHNLNLTRPDGDQAWLNTPVGMAGRMGSGPPSATCLSCIHLDLGEGRWSDKGKAAPCLERRRLANGKGAIQEVPVNSPACSQYAERPDTAAAIAYAEDRLGERISIKREQIERLRQSSKRLEDEIRELQRMRADPGVDVNWRNFEPVGPDEGT